jgi:hypothetical protein
MAAALKQDPARFYKDNKLGEPPSETKGNLGGSHEKSR